MKDYLWIVVFVVLNCSFWAVRDRVFPPPAEPESIPEGTSVGDCPALKESRLPYLLAYVISHELSEYSHCFDESKKNKNAEPLTALEWDLQTNIVRAMYLSKQPGLTKRGSRALLGAIEAAKVTFSKRPTMFASSRPGARSDLSAQEPILPRYCSPNEIFTSAFPEKCFRHDNPWVANGQQ